MRIALTGGIACGKSLFSRFLREQGLETLDADDVVHQLEASGGAAVEPIAARFGADVVGPDGAIDRMRLAPRVFGPGREAARRALEEILFPAVRKALADWSAARTDRIRVAVVPLLFESGWDRDFELVLCLASSPEAQLKRLMETRGLSRPEAEARLAAQMPVAEKAARSSCVIENDAGVDALAREARKTVAFLTERMKHEQT